MSTAVQRIERNPAVHNRLVSRKFASWLDEEVVFELKDGSGKLTRREFSILTESPCTRSLFILHRTCRAYHIDSLADLNRIGLDALLRCRPIGERAAWIAAHILEKNGYDVDKWMNRKSRSGSWRGRIRLAYSRTKKQKH